MVTTSHAESTTIATAAGIIALPTTRGRVLAQADARVKRAGARHATKAMSAKARNAITSAYKQTVRGFFGRKFVSAKSVNAIDR